jgi:hypothetical protein
LESPKLVDGAFFASFPILSLTRVGRSCNATVSAVGTNPPAGPRYHHSGWSRSGVTRLVR